MNTCPHCQTTNAPDNRFCRQCGKSLGSAAGLSATQATMQISAPPIPGTGGVNRAALLSSFFRGKSRIMIGRAPDCDLCLLHPTVSRYHAVLEKAARGVLVHDLGSVNGVYADGRLPSCELRPLQPLRPPLTAPHLL